MSLLGKITKGKIQKAPRVLIYGQAGVGKSSFAADWPDVLFIDVEKRTEHLDVNRVEVDSWDEIMGVMRELYNLAKEEKKTPYKTLVIDTVDHAEHLLFAKLCKEDAKETIDDVGGGYGRGYNLALSHWTKLVSGLEALRGVGITCLLVAHGHVKTFKNPEGEDFDRYTLKMNVKAADYIREKMDAVGFASWQDVAHRKKGDTKAKAVTTGKRLLRFKHSAAYESKPGLNLPDEIPLSYTAFQEALSVGSKED